VVIDCITGPILKLIWFIRSTLCNIEISTQKSEIRNQKSEIRNQKSAQHQKTDYISHFSSVTYFK